MVPLNLTERRGHAQSIFICIWHWWDVVLPSKTMCVMICAQILHCCSKWLPIYLQILDMMGYEPSPWNKINIHVGGMYGKSVQNFLSSHRVMLWPSGLCTHVHLVQGLKPYLQGPTKEQVIPKLSWCSSSARLSERAERLFLADIAFHSSEQMWLVVLHQSLDA